MVMSWIWCILICISILFAILLGRGADIAAAIPAGAQTAVTLSVSMAGAVCLWTGVGRLMEKAGFTRKLSVLLSPLLSRIFPSTKKDPDLAGALSANICANLLGLGNAATPMGIRAVKRLKSRDDPALATDEMCRLVVLNTASIQLIPSTVAAIRSGLGSPAPFDILPAASIRCPPPTLLTAFWMGKIFSHG